MRTALRLHPAARAVLWLDLVVVLLAGLLLYPLARRADTGFAWTIKNPMTAAVLGAGYWSAAVGIAMAAFTREWQRVRIVFVIGIVLTSLMLVPTFVYLDQFHLDEGTASAQRIAWLWLVLYAVQPVVNLAVYVLQERAGGREERAVEVPLLPWFRTVLAVHVVALTAVALALWPLRADGFWPWELPDLGAAAIAVWLVTWAVGAAWCLREGDWYRGRYSFPVYLVFLALLLLAAIRFSEVFDGGAWQTWAWVAAIAVSFAVVTAGALQHHLLSRRGVREVPAAARPV